MFLGNQGWYKKTFDKYPNIFRRLAWWEFRKENDMPEYVKDKDAGYILYKKGTDFNHVSGLGIELIKNDWKLSYYFLEPATKEEYENQKQL